MHYAMDFDFFLRALRACAPTYCGARIGAFRIRPGQKTNPATLAMGKAEEQLATDSMVRTMGWSPSKYKAMRLLYLPWHVLKDGCSRQIIRAVRRGVTLLTRGMLRKRYATWLHNEWLNPEVCQPRPEPPLV